MKQFIILISALLTTAIIISCTTESSINNSNNVESLSLVPNVEWVNRDGSRQPKGVDSIEIRISSTSMGSDMIKKFPYINSEGKKEGTISGVPINIEINVTLTAYDSSENVIYSGNVNVNTDEAQGASMLMEISATQVSPISPTNLNANALSFDRINLVWIDNSNNESGFIIERRLSGSSSSFIPIDTTIPDTNNYLDLNLNSSTTYVYRLIALNGSGTSLNYTNLDSTTTLFKDEVGPELKISSHKNPDTVNTSTITLSGTVKDTSGIYEMFLGAYKINPDNSFWTMPNLPLKEGKNTFTIQVTDNSIFKNRTVDSVIIIYNPSFIDTTNSAPYFTISSGDLDTNIFVGNYYQRILKAEDPDPDDIIRFEVSNNIEKSEDTIKWQATISDTGDNIFWALVIDSSDSSSDTLRWTITVRDTTTPIENTKPEFQTKATDIPDNAIVGVNYSYTVVATDIDPNDHIKYSITQAPPKMSIDSITGEINWTPDTLEAGKRFTVQVSATDDSLESDLLSWYIDVDSIVTENNLPKFNKSKAELDTEVLIGFLYNDSIKATDIDTNAVLTYSSEIAPPHFSISPTTGQMSWQADTVGAFNVKLKVTDQHNGIDTVSFVITVPENRPPVIETPTSDLVAEIYVDEHYARAIKASDPENHSLYFKELEYPTGMTFRENSDNTDSITWTPTGADTGDHQITIQVIDAIDSIAEITWNIKVLARDTNNDPVFTTDSADISGQIIYVGNNYSVKLEANDPDNHNLTYSLISPKNSNIAINGNMVTWTPGEDMVKTHEITVMVSDSLGGSDTITWTVTVDFIPPVWAYDTIYINAPSPIQIPIHIPNRDYTSATTSIQLTTTKENKFNHFVEDSKVTEYDTLDFGFPQPSDSIYLLRAVITNQFGSDTTEPIVIVAVFEPNIIEMYNSSHWVLAKDSLNNGSKHITGANGLIYYSQPLNKNILEVQMSIGDTIGNDPFIEYPWCTIALSRGDWSNASHVDITHYSDRKILFSLIQSDIDNSYDYYHIILPADTAMTSVPLNANAFQQVQGVQYVPFDLKKVEGFFITPVTEYNSSTNLTIFDLKVSGFIPDPK